MQSLKVTLGNEEDFLNFLKPLKKWDQTTLRHYWRPAKKRKVVLAIRHTGPLNAQILYVKYEDLPKLSSGGFKGAMGFVAMKIPKNEIFAFGEHIGPEPIIKRRGRPKKSETTLSNSGV